MIVIVLDTSDSNVTILDVDNGEDLWDLGFKESECSWMELNSIGNVAAAVSGYLLEEGI